MLLSTFLTTFFSPIKIQNKTFSNICKEVDHEKLNGILYQLVSHFFFFLLNLNLSIKKYSLTFGICVNSLKESFDYVINVWVGRHAKNDI